MGDLARDRFMNALRILHSIDRWEIEGLVNFNWESFSRDPAHYLMSASDNFADVVCGIIERRQPDRLKTGETK